MNTQKPTTIQKQSEWHFPLTEKAVELRGRIYRIGIYCLERARGLTAVAEITSTDLNGDNSDQLVFSTVAAATKYFAELAALAK